MPKNPKITIVPSFTDKLLDGVGWGLLTVFWILTLYYYPSLPDEIVTHYNVGGTADGFGPKWWILQLPLIATVLATGLTFSSRFPQLFNYPLEITAENAEVQYRNAALFMRILKLGIILIFAGISLAAIRFPKEEENVLSGWFLPVTFILIFVPVFCFLIRSSRLEK